MVSVTEVWAVWFFCPAVADSVIIMDFGRVWFAVAMTGDLLNKTDTCIDILPYNIVNIINA